MHRIRLTEDKIAHRLELVETLVYRRDQSLPPFCFHAGDDPLVAPDVDDSVWPVIEPGERSVTVLRSVFSSERSAFFGETLPDCDLAAGARA